jgi:Family of unknown function (DUF6069)
VVDRALELAHVDFPRGTPQPSPFSVLLATVACVIGSLIADAALVAVATSAFPSIKGYPHFQLADYGKLTVVGVLIACAAWPVVTRITSTPRWLFFRLAVLVTLFLWLPDVYIAVQGQPHKAVAVLMMMHLAIAVITYNLLVHLARVPVGLLRPWP